VRNFANLACVVVSACVLLPACSGFDGPKQSREYTSTLPAAGITQLTLAGSNGDVHAFAANVDRIDVRARLTTRDIQGIGSDTVTVTRRANEAVVASNCVERSLLFFSAQNCDVEYWITYPRALQASLSLVNGDIIIHGAAAAIDARTTNGDLTIDGATNGVTARTTNGDITIENASGDIAAMSSEGDVSAWLAQQWTGQRIAMKTHFGDVTLHVPQNFHALLHLGTLAGNVRGAAEIPTGSAVVDASTVFGDVRFERTY
jgi:hypothetical protein